MRFFRAAARVEVTAGVSCRAWFAPDISGGAPVFLVFMVVMMRDVVTQVHSDFRICGK